MKGICLPPYFLMDDRVRLLTAHELKGWLAFSLLAARNRREPGVIPAMPPEMRAKKLGMSLKTYEKRLARLTAPGIALIEVRADDALVMVDLWEDDEEDDWDRGDPGPGPVARTNGAIRTERWREKAGHNGSNGDGDAGASQTPAKASQNVSGSVTQASHSASHPRARVGDVLNVSGISKESLDSRDVLNVAARKKIPSPVTPDVTLSVPHGHPRPPSAPLSRPALRVIPPGLETAARRGDVGELLKLTGDDPAKFRGMWSRVWNQCHEHDLLHCWDEGFVILLEWLRSGPRSGRGAVRNKGKVLKTIVVALMGRAGHPYLPAQAPADGDGPPEEPADEATATEVRRHIAEMYQRWEAEDASPEAAGARQPVPAGSPAVGAGITPLDAVYTEEGPET